MMAPGVQRAFIAAAMASASAVAQANPYPWQLNLTPGASDISRRVYDLHMLAFWVCVAIGVIVFGAMIIAMVRFRKSKGAVADSFTHNTRLEAVWTIVPIIILIVLAAPASKLMIDMADSNGAAMTVRVTGYQWRWRYEIPDYKGRSTKVNFISSLDNDSNKARQLHSGVDPRSVKDAGGYHDYLLDVDHPLVLPVGVKIRFAITADDVIHSWWVPSLGWKQDAIPGMVHENWTLIDKPGIYRGQCAELCGRDHGFMPIVVKAVPQAEFEQWLAAQDPTFAASAAATAQAAPVAAPPQG